MNNSLEYILKQLYFTSLYYDITNIVVRILL